MVAVAVSVETRAMVGTCWWLVRQAACAGTEADGPWQTHGQHAVGQIDGLPVVVGRAGGRRGSGDRLKTMHHRRGRRGAETRLARAASEQVSPALLLLALERDETLREGGDYLVVVWRQPRMSPSSRCFSPSHVTRASLRPPTTASSSSSTSARSQTSTPVLAAPSQEVTHNPSSPRQSPSCCRLRACLAHRACRPAQGNPPSSPSLTTALKFPGTARSALHHRLLRSLCPQSLSLPPWPCRCCSYVLPPTLRSHPPTTHAARCTLHATSTRRASPWSTPPCRASPSTTSLRAHAIHPYAAHPLSPWPTLPARQPWPRLPSPPSKRRPLPAWCTASTWSAP